MKKPLLTLILPVYNEADRLVPGVQTAIRYLTKQSYQWELIIVDDGSAVPVKKQLPHTPATILRLSKNAGKGAAIARGVAAAHGKFVVFSDIDFSVSITTLPDILSALARHPVAIASRRAPGSVIATHQPPLRETAGRLFTFLSNSLLGIHVYDSTCGFKGFEARAARRLFRDLTIAGWVFDAEVLWRARRWGLPVVEVPVRWSDKKGSHVHIVDVFRSWMDLGRLWIYGTLSIR